MQSHTDIASFDRDAFDFSNNHFYYVNIPQKWFERFVTFYHHFTLKKIYSETLENSIIREKKIVAYKKRGKKFE